MHLLNPFYLAFVCIGFDLLLHQWQLLPGTEGNLYSSILATTQISQERKTLPCCWTTLCLLLPLGQHSGEEEEDNSRRRSFKVIHIVAAGCTTNFAGKQQEQTGRGARSRLWLKVCLHPECLNVLRAQTWCQKAGSLSAYNKGLCVCVCVFTSVLSEFLYLFSLWCKHLRPLVIWYNRFRFWFYWCLKDLKQPLRPPPEICSCYWKWRIPILACHHG